MCYTTTYRNISAFAYCDLQNDYVYYVAMYDVRRTLYLNHFRRSEAISMHCGNKMLSTWHCLLIALAITDSASYDHCSLTVTQFVPAGYHDALAFLPNVNQLCHASHLKPRK